MSRYVKRMPPAVSTTRRRDWDRWILFAVLLAIAAGLLFIEHHLRGVHSILPK